MKNETGLKVEIFFWRNNSFVLLGLLGIENYRYLYFVLALGLYVVTMALCCLIVYVIWAEESLHEPMYIFIGNLLLNGLFVNTGIFPQLIMNLLLGSSTISFPQCLAQIFCVQSFSVVEVSSFAAMAYDRYLAVSNPLRYFILMTNMKAFKYIFFFWVSSFIITLMQVTQTTMLQLCGVNINNVFCDNMSLVRLACGDTMVNNVSGIIQLTVVLLCALIIIIYCYIRTLWICLKIPRSSSLKAIHTLVTHIATFSVFVIAFLFIYLRYRLNNVRVSLTSHVIISISGPLTSVIVNPIVYGVMTDGLKKKIIHYVWKRHLLRKLTHLK